MFKKIILIVCSVSFSAWLLAQTEPNQRTPNGLKYQIIKTQNNPKIKIGDMVTFNFKLKNFKDSILLERNVPNVPVEPARSPADISEIFTFLAKGDSATAWLSADSLGKYMRQPLPEFTPKGTYLKYYFNILEVKTKNQVELEKLNSLSKQKSIDRQVIEEYVKKNNLKIFTTSSGLSYIITLQGNGAMPQKGKKVKVNYTGKLLDGKVFDTSIEYIAKASNIYQEGRPYQPIEFALGQDEVIKGWDEGIALLKVGSKAIFLIPSDLAYGERGAGGDIPPNAVLLFDVELVGVE